MFTMRKDSDFLINIIILCFSCSIYFHHSQGVYNFICVVCVCMYIINNGIKIFWIIYSSGLEFTLEPSDTLVSEGDSVLLPCSGKTVSNVKPSIRWRGPDGQDIGIVGDNFRTQLGNGSLYISSVEENRGLTGNYQCVLSEDGVGIIVSRFARVTIAGNIFIQLIISISITIQ